MSRYMDLDDEFPEGWKYPNYTLRDVMDRDRDYIVWLLENERITLSDDADNYWESIKHGGY